MAAMENWPTGRIENVAPGVRRLLAGNPSPFTFTGTQTYIVGSGEVAVIDPGPDLSDHVAANDPENKAPVGLHRIAPAAARKVIEQAGFVFVRESNLLRNADDPHTANVFAPAIQGKTDQWIMVFRKPG